MRSDGNYLQVNGILGDFSANLEGVLRRNLLFLKIYGQLYLTLHVTQCKDVRFFDLQPLKKLMFPHFILMFTCEVNRRKNLKTRCFF